MAGEQQTEAELVSDFIRRFVAVTDEVSYFGRNSTGLGFAAASAAQAKRAQGLAGAVMRRETLLGASEASLPEVLEEFGTAQRGASRAQTLLIVRPWSAAVLAISGTTRIEVSADDAELFEAGGSVRLRSADGTVTEAVTIMAIDTGTGPNGGDELVTTVIAGTYDPAGEDVKVLLRVTLAVGTEVASTTGLKYATVDELFVGDSNPVLDGESEALALADKVWIEAEVAGVSGGNADPLTITSLVAPNTKIREVFNPERATAEDRESAFAAKFRAAHIGQSGAAETPAWIESLAMRADRDVIRATVLASTIPGQLEIGLVTRQGGDLTLDRRSAIAAYIGARCRLSLTIACSMIAFTAVEIEATISLSPGAGTTEQRLKAVWKTAADRLAAYLDWRKWSEGDPVDEAVLLSIVRGVPGIAGLVTSAFVPSADVEVVYLPRLVRLTLNDQATSVSYGPVLSTTY